MEFGTPGMIWTAAIPAAVLLYYFYRRQYEERRIPSVLFWEESRRHAETVPFLRHLRRNALFYLQMASLLLLVLLLLSPRSSGAEQETGDLIIVADLSASMLAEEDGKSVLERHRPLMRKLAEQADERPVTVIRAGKSPEILLDGTRDSRQAVRVIDDLDISYEPGEMETTLPFAKTAARGRPATIHIFTDGPAGDLPEGTGGIAWEIHAAAHAPDNVSVEVFGVAQTSDGLSAIARISNDSEAEKRAAVTVRDADGVTAGSPKEIMLPPGGTENIRFDGLPDSPAFSLEAETDDGYEPDNHAFAVAGGRHLPVFADAGLHELVHKGLQSAGADAVLVAPEEADAIPEEAVVFTKDEELFQKRSGRTVLFGRPDFEPSEEPAVVTPSDDPLFSYASPEGVYVSGVYPPFDGFASVAEAGGRPFVQRAADGKIAVLADVSMTDWPLRPSFPLFLWSAIDSFSREDGALGSFLPGEVRPVSAPSSGGSWELYTADGEFKGEIAGGEALRAPAKPGLYVLRSGDEARHLAVTLPDSEKRPASGPSFTAGEQGGKAAAREEPVSPAVPLVLLVLALILAEWEVQRRHGLSY